MVGIDRGPSHGFYFDPGFSLFHELGAANAFPDGPLVTARAADDIPANHQIAGSVLHNPPRLRRNARSVVVSEGPGLSTIGAAANNPMVAVPIFVCRTDDVNF